MDLICPNLPIRSKISVNKKSWYTSHLKYNLILIIFLLKDMSGLVSTLQLCVAKVADDVIAKINNIFSVKTLEIFGWIVPVNLNYESIEGVQCSILSKNNSRWNIRSSPKTCFVKEVLWKHFINLINLLKFLAMLHHKQTYKGGHFK